MNFSIDNYSSIIVFFDIRSLCESVNDYLKKKFLKKDRSDFDEETLPVRDRPGVYAGGDIVYGSCAVV